MRAAKKNETKRTVFVQNGVVVKRYLLDDKRVKWRTGKFGTGGEWKQRGGGGAVEEEVTGNMCLVFI